MRSNKWLLGMMLALWGGLVQAQELVVTFGGDVNFARSRVAPQPDLVRKFATYKIKTLTEDIRKDWDGHVNFVNVETVVSDRNGDMQGKAFVFRSHPEHFRHLMDLGVNAFSLANNHAFDHGRIGLADTLNFFREEARARQIIYSGVGQGPEAFEPSMRVFNGVRVAMTALSFGSSSFEPERARAGMLYLFDADHVERSIAAMKRVDADLKIVSVHYGTENMIGLNDGQRALYRRFVEEAGVHLVLGHHPHVVRGVEVEPERNAAIYYSLGNLLFIGGAEKDGDALGLDYGLMGKAHFSRTDLGMRLTAIEAIPYKGVHLLPRRLRGGAAEARVDHLNRLSRRYLDKQAAQFRMPSDPDAPGVQCFGGPYGPKAAKLCCTQERSLHCDLPGLM